MPKNALTLSSAIINPEKHDMLTALLLIHVRNSDLYMSLDVLITL